MARLLAALALVLGSLARWTHGHAGEPPADAPKFEVSAVVIQDEGSAWALMAEPTWTQGTMRMVAQGAMIGPYRLLEVAPDHVVMQGPSGPPFRVPFSWRGGGGAPTSVGRAAPAPEKGSRPRAERKASDEKDDDAQRSARPERRRAPTREGAVVERPAPSDGSPTAARELSEGLPPRAQAQIEELMRLREQMLKGELPEGDSRPRLAGRAINGAGPAALRPGSAPSQVILERFALPHTGGTVPPSCFLSIRAVA